MITCSNTSPLAHRGGGIFLSLQAERLETRVVSPLRAYGDVVKTKRVKFKHILTKFAFKIIDSVHDGRTSLFIKETF